jgi:hypothetical protein
MDQHELVREIERRIATNFNGEASEREIKRAFRHNKKHKDAVYNALVWPAPGSEDTKFGVTMGPEVSHAETKVYTGLQA